MFKGLLPKEEKYFDDFKEMISYVQEMARLSHEFFLAPKYDPDIFLKLKPLEKRCDEVSSRILKRLNKNFITPFDREDIYALTKKIDGIGDILLAVTIRIDMYRIDFRIKEAEKLTAIIVQQIKELEKVIQDLKRPGGVIEECKAVKDLESEADVVYRSAIKMLFTVETDALTIFKTKEILDMLEAAADKCQSTANVIIAIQIKNS